MPKKQYSKEIYREFEKTNSSSKKEVATVIRDKYENLNNEIERTLMKLDDQHISVSNSIVLGAQPFSTTLESKLLHLVLSQVRENNKIQLYSVKTTDLAKKLYPDRKKFGKTIYRDITKAASDLHQRVLFIKDKANDDWLKLNWVVFSQQKNGLLEVALNPLLMPFLQNLTGNFSVYSLDTILNFKSKYSIRIYESLYAKIQRDQKNRTRFNAGRQVEISFQIEEFRILSSTATMYQRISNLKEKCINPACREISELTDILIEDVLYEAKNGRATDTIIFLLHKQNDEVSAEEQMTKQQALEEHAGLFKNVRNLTLKYVKDILDAFGIKCKKEAITELIALYQDNGERAEAFNQDFQTAYLRASQNVVLYMTRMVTNRHQDDVISDFLDGKNAENLQVDFFSSAKGEDKGANLFPESVREEEKLFFEPYESADEDVKGGLESFEEDDSRRRKGKFVGQVAEKGEKEAIETITGAFNALDLRYDLKDLNDVLQLYAEDIGQFQKDFAVAVEKAGSHPVKYLIEMGRNRNKAPVSRNSWLTEEFEEKYREITEYWDMKAIEMMAENPFAEEEGEQTTLKQIRRTDMRHKRFVHELFENDETVESIKEAIDVAAVSAFFIRTQGSFNFFINPKNYYDIAAGERDYDSEQVKMWQMGKS